MNNDNKEMQVPMRKITILIPCLNEEGVIGEVVKAAWEGLGNDRSHQILIIDSSTDKSAEIAQKLGADVVITPRRGLGQAYRDAGPHIKGDYVVMGDADGTYDYRELDKFAAKLDEGFEFVMGSRFKGSIEPGAMPPLHRYFGTPLTNLILNVIYGSHFSDIHCGMRAMTRNAFLRLHLRSRSWEYASEMIIKSIHLRLKTAEVPINFYKDKPGRLSHVKRQGWFTPWYAGLISLRMMLLYGVDFFLYRPGLVILALGMFSVFALSTGPIGVFALHTMLLAMVLALVGFFATTLGIIARILYDSTGLEIAKWLRRLSYNRATAASGLLAFVGVLLTLPLLIDYVQYRFQLPFGIRDSYYASITGLLLITGACLLFCFSLLLHALAERLELQS